MTNLFQTEILSIEIHSSTLKTFEIAIPKNIQWNFLPGQYVDIAMLDEPSSFCGFSLTSIPGFTTNFSISIKKTTNPLTQFLFQCVPGDQIIVRGPSGDFILDYNRHPKVVLIGGGIGVTPLISMFRTALTHSTKPIVLFFHSAKNESELLFYKEFQEATEKYPNLSYFCTVTRQSDWLGNTSRFTTEFLLNNITQQSLLEFDFYVCGPGSMNSDFEKNLLENGINKSKIHLESYYEP